MRATRSNAPPARSRARIVLSKLAGSGFALIAAISARLSSIAAENADRKCSSRTAANGGAPSGPIHGRSKGFSGRAECVFNWAPREASGSAAWGAFRPSGVNRAPRACRASGFAERRRRVFGLLRVGASNLLQQHEDLFDRLSDANLPVFAGFGVEPNAGEVLVAMHRARDREVHPDLFPLLGSQPNPFRRHRSLLWPSVSWDAAATRALRPNAPSPVRDIAIACCPEAGALWAARRTATQGGYFG